MDSPNYLCTIEASKEYHMPIEKVYQKPYELWFSIHDPNRHGQPTTNMGIESFEYSVDQAHNEAVHLQVIWLHFEVIYHFFCYLSFQKEEDALRKILFDLLELQRKRSLPGQPFEYSDSRPGREAVYLKVPPKLWFEELFIPFHVVMFFVFVNRLCMYVCNKHA